MTDSFDTKDGRTQYLDEKGNLVGKMEIDPELQKENELRNTLEDINVYLISVLLDYSNDISEEVQGLNLILSLRELKLLQLYYEKQLINCGMQKTLTRKIKYDPIALKKLNK